MKAPPGAHSHILEKHQTEAMQVHFSRWWIKQSVGQSFLQEIHSKTWD